MCFVMVTLFYLRWKQTTFLSVFPSGIIGGAAVAKTTGMFCVYLRGQRGVFPPHPFRL